jgi:acyl-CoA thioesterase-1
MKPTCRFLLFLVLVHLLAGMAKAGTTVVCLGDSLTEGYGVAPEESYPSLLQDYFDAQGLDVRVVNAGVSGSTSASAVSRLRWQLRAKPDIVVVALGANDGLRGVEPVATRRNLQSAIQVAKEAGVTVVLAGMKLPPNYGPGYLLEFERIFPELAKENGVSLIPFLLEGVAADPALNLADGIHPNPEGYRIVVKNVLATLKPLLVKAQP